MNDIARSKERQFSDAELLDMAMKLLKHALLCTAIYDCRCAGCGGFKEETGDLLKIIDARSGK